MYWKCNCGFETSARHKADSHREDNPNHKMNCARTKLNCKAPE